MTSRRWRVIVGGAVAIVFAVTSLVGVAPASAGRREVEKPDQRLTELWWKAFLAIPDGADSLDRCDVGTKRVVFLAGTTGGESSRTCSIAPGRSVLVPLINVECSTAEGNGRTLPQLRSCADAIADEFTGLNLTIDGTAVRHLPRFRVRSGLFTVAVAPGNAFAIPPGRTRSVSDGYWALIPPLAPGTHHVSFGGAFPPGPFTTLAHYTLIVRR